MTGWSTDEGLDTTLVLAVLQMAGYCVVSKMMLVSVRSVSVDPVKCGLHRVHSVGTRRLKNCKVPSFWCGSSRS